MNLKDEQIIAIVRRFRSDITNFSHMSEPWQIAQASEKATLKAVGRKVRALFYDDEFFVMPSEQHAKRFIESFEKGEWPV